jgi:hypothetical protein
VSIALFIQHAKGMCRFILYSVSCPSLPYFPPSSHKRQDFRTKDFDAKKRVLIFSTNLSKALFIIRGTVRDNIINVHRSSCKVCITRIFVVFQRNVNYLDSFSKHAQISNFMKIHSMGADLFRVDGQT